MFLNRCAFSKEYLLEIVRTQKKSNSFEALSWLRIEGFFNVYARGCRSTWRVQEREGVDESVIRTDKYSLIYG